MTEIGPGNEPAPAQAEKPVARKVKVKDHPAPPPHILARQQQRGYGIER